MSTGPTIVDARGMLCPWPVIRLARAVRQLGDAGEIRILADDPAAESEIESFCTERGLGLERDRGDTAAFTIKIG